jgi:SAM-dependent methyltransferase
MKQDLYRLFEDKFRGSESLIKGRLRVYTPALEALAANTVVPTALDLGCGRGEWLEILKEHNFNALGVDLNSAMLEKASSRNLNVIEQDAIKTLLHEKDNSKTIISAFHLIEHISFEELQTLIREAFRVLEAGGLLILETPNIENLNVGAHTFYLDPTHIRPIPPLLLEFLAETIGFSKVKILYLNEVLTADITLRDVLMGASPDCALVALKPGSLEREALLTSFFGTRHGVKLDELALRYEARLTTLESRIIASEKQTIALLNSKSWRITAPLRSIGNSAKSIQLVFAKQLKKRLILILDMFRKVISRNQYAKRFVASFLRKSPWLLEKIQNLTPIATVDGSQPKTYEQLRVVKLINAADNTSTDSNIIFIKSVEEIKDA